MSRPSFVAAIPFGWSGFAAGAAALLLAIVVIWAGPFAPQQATGVSLGELAAEIARSAARSAAGLPPPAPEPVARDIDDLLRLLVGLLAALSVILGAVALIRREPREVASSGIALGLLALGIQLFAYAVMMIAGALVVAAVVYALRDTFGGLLGN